MSEQDLFLNEMCSANISQYHYAPNSMEFLPALLLEIFKISLHMYIYIYINLFTLFPIPILAYILRYSFKVLKSQPIALHLIGPHLGFSISAQQDGTDGTGMAFSMAPAPSETSKGTGWKTGQG